MDFEQVLIKSSAWFRQGKVVVTARAGTVVAGVNTLGKISFRKCIYLFYIYLLLVFLRQGLSMLHELVESSCLS